MYFRDGQWTYFQCSTNIFFSTWVQAPLLLLVTFEHKLDPLVPSPWYNGSWGGSVQRDRVQGWGVGGPSTSSESDTPGSNLYSKPQFPHLSNEDGSNNNNPYLMGLLWELIKSCMGYEFIGVVVSVAVNTLKISNCLSLSPISITL